MHAASLRFDQTDLGVVLDTMSPEEHDTLDFGVIGLDRAGVVQAYNRHESDASGLRAARVLGRFRFDQVAPSLDEVAIGERLVAAVSSGDHLDVYLDAGGAMPATLHLVATPDAALAYVLIRRKPLQ